MKKPQIVSSGENHTAVEIGKLADVGQYTLIHPRTGKELHKLFLKEPTGATGTEISVQVLSPHTALPYFQILRKNEETYFVISGQGLFRVDGDCFPIGEGSFIRVAPGGVRGLANTGDTPMVYMVIQSREGSLEEYSSQDGQVVDTAAEWELQQGVDDPEKL
ncbi:MAG: cupin domain-containing protein [Alistipes sp.]|nr:cupin domain-containing protein [Alistipes sp.]